MPCSSCGFPHRRSWLPRPALAWLLLCGVWAADSQLSLAADRWYGRLANGEVVTAAEVADWHEPTSTATAAGRRLLDDANPFVYLADLQATTSTAPGAYVELVGGDRLASEVLAYRTGGESLYESAPPHLLVQTVADYTPPDGGGRRQLRIDSRWVRKIVRESLSGTRYLPATVWFHGGGRVAYRSLRWSETGVTLLTDAGLRSFSFPEVAEIHLPQVDEWQAYAEQVALLSPELTSRLVQLDLADGSRLTTSQERFQARHWGDRKRTEAWLQLVQPAWALDPLWVRFATVAAWNWFDPLEPPLSWSEPREVARDPVFGGSWQWQRDRNWDWI